MKASISPAINLYAAKPTSLLALGKNLLRNHDIGLDDSNIQDVALI